MREDELLRAWAAGDRDAGEVLFDEHFEAVARFFRNKVDGPSDDLVQQTFLGLLEARSRFRGEASFRTFLFAVARNVLRKHYRTSRRERERIDFGTVSVHDLGGSPSVALAKDQSDHVMLQALRRIPLDGQVALELHYWEGMTAAEVGTVLEIPLGTAKTRLRRAKQLLAAEIAGLESGAVSLLDTQTRLETWAQELRGALFVDTRGS